ncbi:MAG: hypothetical protein AB7I50_01895 [Vicinamibacterales bacterium]
MHTPSSTSSARPSWTISRCACGQLSLRLGQVQLELSSDEVARLERLLREAMLEFGIPTSEEHVGRRRRTTH